MHNYLKAIGFGDLKKRSEEKQLLQFVLSKPQTMTDVDLGQEEHLTVYERCFVNDARCGLRILCERDEDGNVGVLQYLPFANPNVYLKADDCTFTKAVEGELINGCLDDYHLGMSLIFSVNNFYEVKNYITEHGHAPKTAAVALVGLCDNAKVLLPVEKTRLQEEASNHALQQRISLLKAAKNGDAEAIESLTVEDINLYNAVTKCIATDDLYSVIDTYFIPTGVECDQYQMMGEILEIQKLYNDVTKEAFYGMTVTTNDVEMTIYVNALDLLGVPSVGMRIKCDLWLQGEVVLLAE